MVPEEIESLSKTTTLLLLDSLLQEVCIQSGLLVSHNLLYSGLKKAHSKKEIIQLSDPPKDLDAHSALLLGPLAQIQSGCSQSVSQSDGHKRQTYAKCLQQPVFPGGHPSKY